MVPVLEKVGHRNGFDRASIATALARRKMGRIKFKIFADFLNQSIIKGGNDAMISVTGKKRRAKSTFAIRLAQMNDPGYTLDNVVFNTLGYAKRVQATQHDLVKGRYIVYDDAGLGLSNKKWYEEEEIIFGIATQIVGYLHMCTILTVPKFTYIESTSRGLLDFIAMADGPRGFFKIRIRDESENLTRPHDNWPYLRLLGYKKVLDEPYYFEFDEVYVDEVPWDPVPGGIGDFGAYWNKKHPFMTAYIENAIKKMEKTDQPNIPKKRKQMTAKQLANLRPMQTNPVLIDQTLEKLKHE